ncbi:hypothetical protein BH10BDE1_BH10BDE1_04510 [soil metagenome]
MKLLKLAIPLLTLSMISGQADDASGASLAMQTKSNAWKYAAVKTIFFGAANCGRAFDQACVT